MDRSADANRDREWLLREKYNGERNAAYDADCVRLESGEPLAYIIGHVPFLDTIIHLDSRPLIPRPETEHWVRHTIDSMKKAGIKAPRILDLCAGSGCIGVAMLKEMPGALVDFAEIDETHHATIKKNIAANDIDGARTNILGGDLFERVTEKYDYIASNPPYIDKDADTATPEVTVHEPHLALFAEEHGFAIIRAILENARAHLTHGGTIWVEHEPAHAPLIATTGHELGYGTVKTFPDQYGVLRYTQLIYSR